MWKVMRRPREGPSGLAIAIGDEIGSGGRLARWGTVLRPCRGRRRLQEHHDCDHGVAVAEVAPLDLRERPLLLRHERDIQCNTATACEFVRRGAIVSRLAVRRQECAVADGERAFELDEAMVGVKLDDHARD